MVDMLTCVQLKLVRNVLSWFVLIGWLQPNKAMGIDIVMTWINMMQYKRYNRVSLNTFTFPNLHMTNHLEH